MEYIFIFLSLSILSSLRCRNIAIKQSETIGVRTWSPYYPKWYILPPRWIRKIFNLKKRLMPKFLFFELIMSLIFAALAPINLIISASVTLADLPRSIIGILIMIHVCLIIVNEIFIIIMSFIMQRK